MSDEDEKKADALPAGSWRARMRDHKAETTVMEWDGAEWEIPANMPTAFLEASNNGDARGVVRSIIGVEGLRALRIPADIDTQTMEDLTSSLVEAAGEVWDIPFRNRSARRSRSTGKH